MLRKIFPSSLTFKILCWFWVTWFISCLSASVPAFLMAVNIEQRPLTEREISGIEVVASLVVNDMLSGEVAPERSEEQVLNWVVADLRGHVVSKTTEIPGLIEEQLILSIDHIVNAQETIIGNLVLKGPIIVSSENAGSYQVVFWHEQNFGLLERMRNLPDWLPWGLAILSTLIMSFLFYFSIVTPLKAISVGFNRLSCGDLSYRLKHKKRHDDFDLLYQNFNQMASRLEEVISSYTRLNADISHELKTPLSRMQMAVALARSAPPDQLDSYLDRAENEGEKLDDLIKQLLELEQIKARCSEYTLEQISVTDLTAEIIDDASFEANGLNLEFSADVPADLSIKAHKKLFLMALENLIRNAFKYASEKVTLQVKTKNGWGWIEFIVCDDGPGVPESELDKLIDPFYRADESRDRDTGGVGLGLAIAAEAAHAHHGELRLKNLPEGGFCASLCLPFKSLR